MREVARGFWVEDVSSWGCCTSVAQADGRTKLDIGDVKESRAETEKKLSVLQVSRETGHSKISVHCVTQSAPRRRGVGVVKLYDGFLH